jgi:hypothetical protein
VPNGVSDAQPGGAGLNGSRIEQSQLLRVGSRRVFGHVHDPQAFFDRKGNRAFGAGSEIVEAPPFRVLANRAGSDERATLNRQARPLRDLDDWRDVGNERSRGAVGANLHAIVADGPRQLFDILRDLRPGPGQSDVCRIDAERVHVPENLDPFIDGRRADRRRLQTIPQRLVVQQRLWMTRTDRVVIPVVN